MELTILPPALERVETPNHLRTTQLASAGPCLLKAIVRPPSVIVVASPFALLGTIAHRLVEAVARGSVSNSRQAIAQEFDRMVDSIRPQLEADARTIDFADLRVAFSKSEWERRRFSAIVRAENVVRCNYSPPVDSKEPTPSLSLASVLSRNSYQSAEVPFESQKLRLRGQIDYVHISGDLVTLWDFKTGDVTDAEGEIDDVTAFQMRLYALAVLEHRPFARLELRVAHSGGVSVVKSNPAVLDEARIKVEEIWTKLNEQGIHHAETLCSFGPSCRHCKLRPVCPEYRRSVRDLWNSPTLAWRPPIDIAGLVSDIAADSPTTVAVRLTDLAGRKVKIHRVKQVRLPSISSKQSKLWFFDLATGELNDRVAARRYPRNFHERPQSTADRTAWNVQVFYEPS